VVAEQTPGFKPSQLAPGETELLTRAASVIERFKHAMAECSTDELRVRFPFVVLYFLAVEFSVEGVARGVSPIITNDTREMMIATFEEGWADGARVMRASLARK
jgi:hypothetical protein